MAAQLLQGGPIAVAIKEELNREVERLTAAGVSLCLAAVQVGQNPASAVYVRQQQRNCEQLGIHYQLHELEADISPDALADCLGKLGANPGITGIILQLPLPEGMDTRRMQAVIDPTKDVEGVSPANAGWVVYGRPRLAPCTALAVVELIGSTGIDLYGKNVTVVGHSDIVGKPVGLLLLDKFATVSICHIGTAERGELADYVGRAEVLVVAVGKPGVIKGAWVRQGAMVVDVGINRVGDKIVGDVEFEAAQERAAYITPVPGGVGPLTVTMLMKNTIEAAKWQRE